MRHIRVLICQVDDGAPDLMSELACFDLTTPTVATLQPETALDALEATTQEIGTTILRRLLHAQWAEVDAAGEFGHQLVFILNPAHHTTQVAHGRLLEQCTRSLDLHPTASPAHDENGGTSALLRTSLLFMAAAGHPPTIPLFRDTPTRPLSS